MDASPCADYLTKVVVVGKSSAELPVSDIMTPQSKLMTVTPAQSVVEVMELMIDNNFRHVPVVSHCPPRLRLHMASAPTARPDPNILTPGVFLHRCMTAPTWAWSAYVMWYTRLCHLRQDFSVAAGGIACSAADNRPGACGR